MSNHGELVGKLIVFIVAIAALLVLRGCDDCARAESGNVHVSRFRGDRVERCNGAKWVPIEAKDLKP